MGCFKKHTSMRKRKSSSGDTSTGKMSEYLKKHLKGLDSVNRNIELSQWLTFKIHRPKGKMAYTEVIPVML